MNKYQKALNYLDFYCSVRHTEQQELLQELIDKETPIKPNKKHLSSYCSNCGGYVGEGKNYALAIGIVYCKKCGVKIDWSDEV